MVPYKITCHPLNEEISFYIDNVNEVLISDDLLLIGFAKIDNNIIKDVLDAFVQKEIMLFNFIFNDSDIVVKSFIGRYSDITESCKKTYIVFKKDV